MTGSHRAVCVNSRSILCRGPLSSLHASATYAASSASVMAAVRVVMSSKSERAVRAAAFSTRDVGTSASSSSTAAANPRRLCLETPPPPWRFAGTRPTRRHLLSSSPGSSLPQTADTMATRAPPGDGPRDVNGASSPLWDVHDVTSSMTRRVVTLFRPNKDEFR